MATFISNSSNGYKLTLTTNIMSQDIINNTSTISWSLQLSNTTSTFQRNGQYFEVYINGSKTYSVTKQITCLTQNSSQTIATGTTIVPHNSDGSKVMSVNFKWIPDNKSLSYMPSVDLYGSGTTTLTTIPREATIELSLSNDEGTFNYTTYNPANFSLQVALKVNGITFLTSTTSTLNRVLTSGELDILWANSTTTSKPTITAEIKSYNGATLIGTKTDTATISIINASPTNIYFTWADQNSKTLDLTGDGQKLVLNGSNAFMSAYTANGRKKATITSYRFTNGANSLVGQTGTFVAPTSQTFTLTVEDSRGITSTLTRSATYVAYTPPIIQYSSVGRVNDGEAPAQIAASGTMWVGSFGAKSNVITFKYYYREKGATDWQLGNTVVTGTTQASWSISKVVNGDLGTLGFTTTKQFEILIQAIDSVRYDAEIKTLLVSIDAFAINKVYGGYQATVGCAGDGTAGLKVAGIIKDSSNNTHIPFEVGDVKMTFNNVDPSIKYGGTWTLWKTEASCYYWRRTA